MKTNIGKFDRATRTVPVTFEQASEAGGRFHARDVNAVIGPDGKHDRAATIARVEQVAAGVAHKFTLGLLGTPSAPEPAAAPTPDWEE